jgi:hypothetical protein
MTISAPAIDSAEHASLLGGSHATPHDVLGAHARVRGPDGVVVRVWHAHAVALDVLWADVGTGRPGYRLVRVGVA